jgi:hypothetical protein
MSLSSRTFVEIAAPRRKHMGSPPCVFGDIKKQFRSFRLRLHSSLRQSGTGFSPGVCGMAEAMPFRFLPQQSICMLQAKFDDTHYDSASSVYCLELALSDPNYGFTFAEPRVPVAASRMTNRILAVPIGVRKGKENPTREEGPIWSLASNRSFNSAACWPSSLPLAA